jgi:hypothetical protein
VEDVIGNLLYVLHMIAHVHTNILRYRGHICHEGLHVCVTKHRSPQSCMLWTCGGHTPAGS